MKVTGEQLERLERRAGILHALANPSRLFMLERMEQGDLTVSELTELVGSDMSTVSRHLSVLRDAGIIACSQDGNRRLHRLRARCVLGFLDCVEEILEEGRTSCTCETDGRIVQAEAP